MNDADAGVMKILFIISMLPAFAMAQTAPVPTVTVTVTSPPEASAAQAASLVPTLIPVPTPTPAAQVLATEPVPTATVQPSKPALPAVQEFRLIVLGGLTFGNKAELTVKSSSGTALGSAKSKLKNSTSFGVEGAAYLANAPVAVGVVVEREVVKFEDGSPRDIQLSLMPFVRGVQRAGIVEFWGSVSAGLTFYSFGESSSTSGGYRTTLKESMVTDFIFSPKIGMDFHVADRAWIGLQASYYTASSSVGFDVVEISTNNTGTGTIDYSKSGWSGLIRFGIGL